MVAPDYVQSYIKPPETLIYHCNVRRYNETSAIDDIELAITKSYLFAFSRGKLLFKRPVGDLHSVEEVEHNEILFYIYFRTQKSIFKTSDLSSGSHPYIKASEYSCSSSLERSDVIRTFAQVIQDYWQEVFERFYIDEPEIYQFHLFLLKVNPSGKNQLRCFVMSTGKLYNIVISGEKLKRCRWVVGIESVQKIMKSRDTGTDMMICMDPKSAGSVRDDYIVRFKDERERSLFSFEIRRIYFSLTNHSLPDVTDNFF